MVGCERWMRTSMSEAHKPTPLPMEQPHLSLSAARMRLRVRSAMACRLVVSTCSELFMEDSNRAEIDRCQYLSCGRFHGQERRTSWRSKSRGLSFQSHMQNRRLRAEDSS